MKTIRKKKSTEISLFWIVLVHELLPFICCLQQPLALMQILYFLMPVVAVNPLGMIGHNHGFPGAAWGR